MVPTTTLTCESTVSELLATAAFKPWRVHNWIGTFVGSIEITVYPAEHGLEGLSIIFPREGVAPYR